MTGDPSTWVQEDSTEIIVATYYEYARDEWSVYIRNDHGISLQIDLWRAEVLNTTGTKKKLHTVTKAYGTTGFGLTSATYEDVEERQGTLVKIWGEKEWHWTRPDRTEAALEETGRDTWSVYLNDDGTFRVQIDYHTKKVIVTHSEHSTEYHLIAAKGYRHECKELKYCARETGPE